MAGPLRVGGWWARRSLRVRLTVVSTTVLAVGLVCGSVALAALFFHQRVEAVDANVRDESATLAVLVGSGQLPNPLPVPAGQPVLAQVIDGRGTVRAASLAASDVVPLLSLTVLQAHEGQGTFTTSSSALGPDELRVNVVLTHYDGTPVLLVSAVSFADVGATLDALFRTLAVAVPIVLLAAGIATWLAVGAALRPVDELREAADDVARAPNRQTPRLPVPLSGDELARLAATLNSMLERLSAAGQQQRVFVADAAHELRSPIAAIRAQLEVALTTPTAADEWPRIAADALLDVERVGTLADDMLLLARLDADGPARRAVVDLGELAGLGPTGAWVVADAFGVRRACDNLVSNARRHARTGYSVAVESDSQAARLTVDDDGTGIAAADRERVLERWVRLDEARTRDEGGAGLGLAIASSVARAHDGDLTLSESPLGGLRAVLRLPVAPSEPAVEGVRERRVHAYRLADPGATGANRTWVRSDQRDSAQR